MPGILKYSRSQWNGICKVSMTITIYSMQNFEGKNHDSIKLYLDTPILWGESYVLQKVFDVKGVKQSVLRADKCR